MKDGLAFVGQIIATLVALAVGLFLMAAVFIGDVIALQGCAICDDASPNYAAAVIITAIGVMLGWIIFLVWRAACTTDGYR